MRRHRTIVAAVSIALLAIAVIIGFYTTRLTRERDRARIEARKAQEVSEFLTGIFEVSDPNVSRGDIITARELLDTATVQLRTELANQAEVRAMLLSTVSSIYYNLGLYFQARELAFEATELSQKVLGENHVDYARNLSYLALILDEAAERDSALVVASKALKIVTELYPEGDTTIATIQFTMAYIHRHLGAFDSAEYYYRAVLQTQRTVLGNAHADVGNTLNHLGRLYFQRGQYTEAEPIVREAIANLRAVYGRDDHFEVLACMGNLGGILAGQERYAAAESVFVQLRTALSRMAGADHAFYGGVTNQLANAVYQQGRIETAHNLFTEALESAKKNLPYDHPAHVGALIGLGRLLSEHGDFRDAEPMLRKAMDIRQRTLPVDHWQIATVESLLADCLRRAKKFEDGAPLAKRSFESLNEKFGPKDPRTITARKAFELIYVDWGKPLPILLPESSS